MKILQYTCALILSVSFLACSSDDDATENLSNQKGNVVLKYDNSVAGQDFIFSTQYSKSNNETYTLTNLKYIVSNVRLKTASGVTFTYPESKNAFIIDESDANTAGQVLINLEDVDAGDYTEITFGIGIDQDRFAKGADGQGAFLDLASEEGMLWSWATGYKFVRFDGSYSTSTVNNDALNIHMGSVGTTIDNYKEVTLTFPNTIKVRSDKTPQVHIVADISKVFDGATPAHFSDGYNQVHTDEAKTNVIATNIQGMFSVHHVHND